MARNKYLVLLMTVLLVSCGNKGKSNSSFINDSFISSSTESFISELDIDSSVYGESQDSFNLKPGQFAYFQGESDNLEDLSTIYGGYYKDLTSWDNGIDLKHKLFNIIYDEEVFTPLTYSGNWTTNKEADQSLSNLDNVSVIYNKNEQNKEDTYSSSNTSGWQREHAFCASLLTGSITSVATQTPGIATDFHNLFAANGGGNASRSDKNFGVVSVEDDAINMSTSARREGFNYKASNLLFEPNDEEKGMLSRAVLYMATMYGQDSWNNNKYKVDDGVFIRENTCSISDKHCLGNSSTLVNWANTYKVNRQEYQHNEKVFLEQHNRNPFVDFPNLVDFVFGNKKYQSGTISDLVSSYKYLGISQSDKYANMAIKCSKTIYEVGSSLTKNDVNVYNVMKDYSLVNNDNYMMMYNGQEITDSYLFSSKDVGKKKVSVITNKDSVTYNIEVREMDLDSCSDIHYFTSYLNDKDLTSRGEVRSGEFSINDTSWSISYSGLNVEPTDFVSSISSDSTYGVKIGTSTKYFDKMIFTCNTKIENVDAIFLRGGLSSGVTEKVEFAIYNDENEKIYSKTETISKDKLTVLTKISTPLFGYIKIVFNNTNHKAIYLSAIAFNAINS